MVFLFKALAGVLLAFFIIFSPNVVFSEEASSSSNSAFEVFWPLSAGKTESDSFYFLKLFKEQIRGWLIFGDTKKADYAVFLGTKRVLETEKLLKDGKSDLALKSLERAQYQFSSAHSYVKTAASKGKFSREEIRRDRLLNIKTLIDQLNTGASEEMRAGLDSVRDKVDAILRDFLP